jgi:hypothetical protein
MGPVESPVYSRRQSSPFVDGTNVGARRTSGSFHQHVVQVSPRWSLVSSGACAIEMPRTSVRAPPQLYQPYYQAPPPLKNQHRRRTLQLNLEREEPLPLSLEVDVDWSVV